MDGAPWSCVIGASLLPCVSAQHLGGSCEAKSQAGVTPWPPVLPSPHFTQSRSQKPYSSLVARPCSPYFSHFLRQTCSALRPFALGLSSSWNSPPALPLTAQSLTAFRTSPQYHLGPRAFRDRPRTAHSGSSFCSPCLHSSCCYVPLCIFNDISHIAPIRLFSCSWNRSKGGQGSLPALLRGMSPVLNTRAGTQEVFSHC